MFSWLGRPPAVCKVFLLADGRSVAQHGLRCATAGTAKGLLQRFMHSKMRLANASAVDAATTSTTTQIATTAASPSLATATTALAFAAAVAATVAASTAARTTTAASSAASTNASTLATTFTRIATITAANLSRCQSVACPGGAGK